MHGADKWYYTYGNSSGSEISKDNKQLRNMCLGLENAPYVVIDDRLKLYNCDAPWDVLREGSSDMKNLADEIRKMGARPGIWFRPLADGSHISGLDKPEHGFYDTNFILTRYTMMFLNLYR